MTGVLLVLLGLVALASGEGRVAGEGGITLPGSPMLVGDVVFTLAVTLCALGAVVLLVGLTRVRPERDPRGRRMLRDLLIFFVLAGALWAAVSDVRRRPPPDEEPVPGAGELGARRPGQATQDAAQAAEQAEFLWPLAATVGMLGLAALALLFGRSSRSDRHLAELPEPGPAEPLALVLDDALSDLGAEADPRRAVIAAYARMEHVLAAHGHPRRPYEAPFEYLARILWELHVRAAAVLALTELFERAKFSLHEIDGSMKAEALDALTAVRDDLRAFA